MKSIPPAITGKVSMPKAFNSDAEVIAYVAKTRGAIGYVSASAGTEGVKVLDVTFEGGSRERRLITRVEPEYPETLRQMHIGGIVRLQITISPGKCGNCQLARRKSDSQRSRLESRQAVGLRSRPRQNHNADHVFCFNSSSAPEVKSLVFNLPPGFECLVPSPTN
jgi:hypothetical protein